METCVYLYAYICMCVSIYCYYAKNIWKEFMEIAVGAVGAPVWCRYTIVEKQGAKDVVKKQQANLKWWEKHYGNMMFHVSI